MLVLSVRNVFKLRTHFFLVDYSSHSSLVDSQTKFDFTQKVTI